MSRGAPGADQQRHAATDRRHADPAGGTEGRMTELETVNESLVGVRLRDSAPADDYKLVGDLVLHVGDVVSVETQSGTALGEVRRARRPVPEFRRDRLYRRVIGLASGEETREYREQRRREEAAIVTSQRLARARNLAMKVGDVEEPTAERPGSVDLSSDER